MDDPDAIPSRMRKAKWMWRSIETTEKPDSAAGAPLGDLVDKADADDGGAVPPRKRDKQK